MEVKKDTELIKRGHEVEHTREIYEKAHMKNNTIRQGKNIRNNNKIKAINELIKPTFVE